MVNMKQKIVSLFLIVTFFLNLSPLAYAGTQDIQIKQKANKKKIVQKITVKQLGDLNQALVDSAFNAKVKNPKKNFKIVQKIKVKQKGDYNDAVLIPTINAKLGKTKNVKVVQKVKIKQKGDKNKTTARPTIFINPL